MVDYYKRAPLLRARLSQARAPDRPARDGSLDRAGFAGRRVLEVACGTGWWTPHGARDCALAGHRPEPRDDGPGAAKPLPAGKCASPPSTPTASSNWAIRASTPPSPAAGGATCRCSGCPWLATLHARLRPGARVVFLDNSFVQTSSTPLVRRDDAGNTYQHRTLDDGSVHEVLKNFPHPRAGRLAAGPARAQHRVDRVRALLGPQPTNLPDANPPRPRVQGHARRRGGRGHPAQVRALRLLHRHLPHLPAAGRRTRRPARAHLPDQAGAGRCARHAQARSSPGPLPDLPQLRDHLPQRRAVRAPGGHRPQAIVEKRSNARPRRAPCAGC
jgi:hypothetical protein